jgi:hypothetical protein
MPQTFFLCQSMFQRYSSIVVGGAVVANTNLGFHTWLSKKLNAALKI